MKTVFHVSDGADEIQDAAIRYSGGIFEDDCVDIDAVAVVANASGIGLVQTDSTYAEEIRSLSEGDVRFIGRVAKSSRLCSRSQKGTLSEQLFFR